MLASSLINHQCLNNAPATVNFVGECASTPLVSLPLLRLNLIISNFWDYEVSHSISTSLSVSIFNFLHALSLPWMMDALYSFQLCPSAHIWMMI